MRRVLLTLFALFLTLTLAALWYASDRGFTSKWRRRVSQEFQKRGVEVTLRRLTLDPMRGLVAKDVHVYDAHDRKRVLAVIDEMVLQVNYANLIRGKTFLDALDLHDANLSFPLDPQKPRGPKIEIARLNGRLFLPPQQFYLAYADAEVFGLHVNASGRLIHPQAFPLSEASGNRLPPDLVTRIFDELKGIKFEGGPPEVSLTFSGDLAQPDQIFVDLALWAERVRRKKYQLKNLYVGASWRGGTLDLKQLVATDAGGELRLSGLWERESNRAQLQLRSGIDAVAIARMAGPFPWLDDFIFYTPPAIDLRLDATLGDKPEFLVTGHLAAKKFAWRNIVFERAESGFSWDGGQWSLRDVQLARTNGEEIRGDALQVEGDFRARLDSTLNPVAFWPLLTDPRQAETLRQFVFPHAPHLKVEAHGLSAALDRLRIDGEVTVGSASFRGVSAESAQATLHYENQILSVAPFRVQRSEGEGSGRLQFDFGTADLRFDKVHARVNPLEVALWIDSQWVNHLLPYHFVRQPPDLLVDGVVNARDGKSTRLAIQVDAAAGMDYTLWKKNLSLPRLNAHLLLTGDRLKISDFSASLLGGILSGGADISLNRVLPGCTATLALADVDFGRFTKLYFDRGEPHGRLNGRAELTASGGDARGWSGRGEVSVTDGDVFAIPFLGPLRGILDGLSPALGHDGTPQAGANFTVSSGVIATDDLTIQGQRCTLRGNGKLSFPEDKLDFTMRIDAPGALGLLLAPVSRLFEYRADQQLSDPAWRLQILPRASH
jgi:hypothetical protein